MKLDFRQKLVRDSSRLLSAVLATSKSLRLRYVVLATFPVACFATYIIGILTDTLGFDLNIWVQLQAGIWMWTAMAVLAMLPGSLKESMGRVCFLAGLFGLFIPATVYVVAMSESDSPNDMGSEWFWFVCCTRVWRRLSGLAGSSDTCVLGKPMIQPARWIRHRDRPTRSRTDGRTQGVLLRCWLS